MTNNLLPLWMRRRGWQFRGMRRARNVPPSMWGIAWHLPHHPDHELMRYKWFVRGWRPIWFPAHTWYRTDAPKVES